MHPKLYQKIIRVKQKLARLQQRVRDKTKSFDPSGVWNPWHGQARILSCAGADGSFNHVKRLGFYLAGATGASVSFPREGEPTVHYLAELDIMLSGKVSEEQVRAVMQTGSKIMELRALNNAAQDVPDGVILVDGSLVGLFRNYIIDMAEARILRLARTNPDQQEDLEPLEHDQQENLLNRMRSWAHNAASSLQNLMDRDWASWELFQDIQESEQDPGFALGMLMMLSRIEYLALLRDFMEHADRVVGISKSSSDCQLNPDLPDIYLLSVATFAPGHTQAQDMEVPVIEGFDPIKASFFYARTEAGRPVFRVELFKPASQAEPEELLGFLRAVSVAGYPYPLAKAHKLCTLSFRAMERYLGLAGGSSEPTGREAL